MNVSLFAKFAKVSSRQKYPLYGTLVLISVLSSTPCSKQLPDDWLERMFHSCQHRRPFTQESLDHPETHPLLMSQLVCNCEGLLWFWATYESAQYCLLARLKTPLGSPNDTFRAIESESPSLLVHSWNGRGEPEH